MSSDRLSFDLTDRPWLPVLRTDGAGDVLSLRDVFAQARSVRRLAADLPTQEFALLRLMIAILHDALDGPQHLEEWQDLWEGELPVEKLDEYLDGYRDHFDLLHPDTPFLQTPSLRTAKDEVSSLDKIVADVPNGAPFFSMRGRGVESLEFAEAARWLVHAQAFDTSGIKSGAVGDPRVKGGKGYPQGLGWAGSLGGVLATGDDLHETLLLNLVAFDTSTLRIDAANDRPSWTRPTPSPAAMDQVEAKKRPYGPRDLYTWPSRRIRLHFDDEGVYGVVLAYGDPLTPQNRHVVEPMTAWRRSQAQEKKLRTAPVYMPRTHDPSRTAWRGLGALIARNRDGAAQRQEAAAGLRPGIVEWLARLAVEGPFTKDRLLRVRLIGAVYGTQQSVIDEVIDDEVQMPIMLLHARDSELGIEAIDAVADAEAAVNLLGDLAADLAKAAGDIPEPRKLAARTRGFAALDGAFRAWLAALKPDDDPADVRAIWQETAHSKIRRLGAELVDQAGESAWQGRIVMTNDGREIWLSSTRANQIFMRRLGRALPGARPSAEAITEALA